MEVLLWLWLFDSRWLFSLKAPLSLYQTIWVLSMLINGFMCCSGLLFVVLQDSNALMNRIVMSNVLLCGLTLVFSIWFIIQISREQDAHNKAHEHMINAIPGLKDVVHVKDFWVRNKSLNSTIGLLLLVCSLMITAFTSVLLMNKDKWIIDNLNGFHEQNILYYYSIYQVSIILFCISEFLFSILIKVTSLASVYLCRNLHVKVSKYLNGASKRKTLDYSHIQAKVENQAKCTIKN